ncbi:MAG: hypothetical protein V4467_00045 [Patescibacteria group bacterium]
MQTNPNRGFIKLIILIVAILIILGYFGLNFEKIVTLPVVKENLAYGWNLFVTFFNDFVIQPAILAWGKSVEFLVSIWEKILNLF